MRYTGTQDRLAAWVEQCSQQSSLRRQEKVWWYGHSFPAAWKQAQCCASGADPLMPRKKKENAADDRQEAAADTGEGAMYKAAFVQTLLQLACLPEAEAKQAYKKIASQSSAEPGARFHWLWPAVLLCRHA